MPRCNIDYSKTLIYKLCCNDTNILQCYVGQTTNFKNRKNAHKKICNNINGKKYNTYLYKFIRDNGRWNNWNMIPIEIYPCENHIQSKIREQYWKDSLKAELNINKCYSGVNDFNCDIAKYHKLYTEANKDELIEKHKIYRENNKESISEKKKKYREENNEYMHKKDKENYEKHKDKIKERYNKICNCDCGSIFKYSNFTNHKKSQKHIKYINSLNIEK